MQGKLHSMRLHLGDISHLVDGSAQSHRDRVADKIEVVAGVRIH